MSVDSGPTTVGSIVAKVRMDRDQWIRDVAATKAEARELEGLDPDIRIDDNAAAVTARLAAAKAATDALGNSSDELGRKTRRTTDEMIRANEANRTSVTRVGAIVTAVALLAPLLGPVGAAAVGVGTAFLGMGAAGVLALIGIHNEMEDGTRVGKAYRAGLDSLSGSMRVLASTAALNMLSSFKRVVNETRAELPMLNTQVGQFSSLLGRSGGNLFSGAINSLHVLNPLFLTAAVYLERLTAGFERWSEGDGIREFGAYAITMLPQVTEVLGKLATMVLHILEALAPLGTTGLAVISGLADAINGIPVEILGQFIASITWGAIAFKAWGIIAPTLIWVAQAMGAVGAATTIATGAIGGIVGVLAALAGVIAVVVMNNRSATGAIQEYTQALQADTNAIGENTRATVAKKLADSGVLESAKKLGINLKTLTEATLGNADALDQLSLFTRAADGDQDALQKVMKQTGLSYMDTVGLLNTLVVGMRTESDAVLASADSLQLQEEALVASNRAGRDKENVLRSLAGQARMTGDEIEGLSDQIRNFGSATLDTREAQRQLEQAMDDLSASIAENGSTLDVSTQEGRDNQAALDDLATATLDLSAATYTQTGSQELAAKAIADGREKLIEMLAQLGITGAEAEAYADRLGLIPANVGTFVALDTATAERRLQNFIDSYNGRTIKLGLTAETIVGNPSLGYTRPGGGAMGGTVGGVLRGMAGGGSVVGPGTAGSDTAGLFRLAHGEEVTSNVFGQADRHRFTLKAINAGVTSMASLVPSPAAQQPIVKKEGDKTVNLYITGVQNEDPRVIAQIVGQEVRRVMASKP